ncbi:MAG: hypothetical protein HY644_06590 [Acidobacteria bacterium]|nr:hypothetical protein [Acidobacteriota bacterium]
MKKLITIVALAAFCMPIQAADWKFKVQHIRTPLLRDQEGTLVIGAADVQYQSKGEKQPLRWGFGDIQQFKLEPSYLEILTYQDQKWRFGKDKIFRFKILEGSVDTELSHFLRQRIAGVFVTAILPRDFENPVYKVPVRHRLAGRDSQGMLEVYNDKVMYRSDSKQESRIWTYQQIESFAFPSLREFEVVTDEKKFGGPTRTFRFQLKEVLPESIYDYLWIRIYGSAYYPAERRPSDLSPVDNAPAASHSITGD